MLNNLIMATMCVKISYLINSIIFFGITFFGYLQYLQASLNGTEKKPVDIFLKLEIKKNEQ